LSDFAQNLNFFKNIEGSNEKKNYQNSCKGDADEQDSSSVAD
jgi:hypothetical protein